MNIKQAAERAAQKIHEEFFQNLGNAADRDEIISSELERITDAILSELQSLPSSVGEAVGYELGGYDGVRAYTRLAYRNETLGEGETFIKFVYAHPLPVGEVEAAEVDMSPVDMMLKFMDDDPMLPWAVSAVDRIRILLDFYRKHLTQEGYVSVPREPTKAMLEAACDPYSEGALTKSTCRYVWHEMIAAAPAASGDTTEEIKK